MFSLWYLSEVKFTCCDTNIGSLSNDVYKSYVNICFLDWIKITAFDSHFNIHFCAGSIERTIKIDFERKYWLQKEIIHVFTNRH